MIKKILLTILKYFFSSFYKRRYTNQPIYLKHYISQKLFRINHKCYWPVDIRSQVIGAEFIYVGIGSAPGYSIGCYIVASKDAPIIIGNYTIIGPNVILPARNHNTYDYRLHNPGGIKIGNYCWIGANSVILPNVKLGNHVVVAAGSVVTKSFLEGYVVIAGNPAKIIKYIDADKCIEKRDLVEYHGYIEKKFFNLFCKENLKLKEYE